MEDERRKRALRYLNTSGIVQCLLGLLLFFLGLAARIKHGSYVDSVPPYYIGAFIGMAVGFIQAGLGLAVFIRGKDCVNKLEAAEKIGCIMQTYCLAAIINEIVYIVASLLVAFTGVCDSSRCSYTDTGENRRLAIAILVFIIIGVITSAIGLVIVCKYSSSFGLKMLSRGQYQISNLVDNTDAVIAYIAAEQTATVDTDREPVNQNHHQPRHHQDPRLALPNYDYSSQHLQHYLTQQYKDRIRKRRKRKRKRNRESQYAEGETRRRRNGREAPYILPPLAAPSGHYDHHPRSVIRTPPSPSSTPPPPPPVHYPPPSPSPPETRTPPLSRRTPPLTPSTLLLPEVIPTQESPPPHNSYTSSPPPTPPPPTPPLNHPGIIHVIPCGETLEEDLYSP